LKGEQTKVKTNSGGYPKTRYMQLRGKRERPPQKKGDLKMSHEKDILIIKIYAFVSEERSYDVERTTKTKRE